MRQSKRCNTAIDAKHHTLRIETPSAPLVMELDPVRMTQVITNILGNAVKYTPPGGVIQLGVRLDSQFLVIYVRDNGIGLTNESMKHVFDMFTRIESRVSSAEGGLGIGLALAKGSDAAARRPSARHERGPRQGQRVFDLSAARAHRRAGNSGARRQTSPKSDRAGCCWPMTTMTAR